MRLEVCQRLWSEDVIEHHRESSTSDRSCSSPNPFRRRGPRCTSEATGPPLFAAPRRQSGTAGSPSTTAQRRFQGRWRELARRRRSAGRAGAVEISLAAASADLDHLRGLADAGVDRALVRPWNSSKDALDGLRRFADQVLPDIAASLTSSA